MTETTPRTRSEPFVKLADAILFDADLSDGAVRAYAALGGYARMVSSATFELSADQLGTLLGRSHDIANRRTRELEQRGLLVVERNRGRNLPNRFTVVDPQAVMFGGLRVDGGHTQKRVTQAHAKTREPAHAKTREPYIGREDRERQRNKRSAERSNEPQPVDNPRRSAAAECPQHRGQPAGNCRSCRADAIGAA